MAGTATSDELRQIVDGARRLRMEVFEELERRLDLLDDADAAATDEQAVQAESRALEVGLHRLRVPDELGGLGASVATSLMATEALASGAPGFALELVFDDTVRAVLARFADRDSALSEALETNSELGQIGVAFLQPHDGAEGLVRMPSSGLGIRSRRYRSRPEPDGSITEQTGAIRLRNVTLTDVAHADRIERLLLFVGSPPGNASGVEAYLFELDGGVVRSGRHRMMGLRVWPRGDVLLEDVVLTPDQRVCADDEAAEVLEELVAAWSLQLAAVALGIASRSYDHGYEYACGRVQGGKPIIQHQNVATVLWRSASLIETLRYAIHGAAAAGAFDDGPELRLAAELRHMAMTTVERVTIDMLELLGGYGITTEYPLEKLYRDAKVLANEAGSIEGQGVHGEIWLP